MRGAAALGLAGALIAVPAAAQQLDFTQGGPIEVTAVDGIEWRQNEQTVIARGNARAVRQNVTVLADRLIAHYRKKPDASGGDQPKPQPAAPQPAATDIDTGGNEIFRLEAVGNVRIFTATDRAQGDYAIYDIDQAVLVLTGRDLRLTTPQQVLTARDSMEYWPQQHMAVGRGNAVVVTSDARRLAADTLVGYTEDKPAPTDAQQKATPVAASGAPPTDPLAASGKLKKVDAFGNVEVRTTTDIVRGDKAVYVPETGIARVLGHVRITRGQNQLNGAEADVNLKTNISTLLAGSGGRVEGLVVPKDAEKNVATAPGATPAAPPSPPSAAPVVKPPP
jgi:lipopolysaccharide export system protein LptA